MNTETLEQEARRLRDAIYGPQPDTGWAACSERWLADIEWLRANQLGQKATKETKEGTSLPPFASVNPS